MSPPVTLVTFELTILCYLWLHYFCKTFFCLIYFYFCKNVKAPTPGPPSVRSLFLVVSLAHLCAARTGGTPAVCKVCAVDTLLNHIAVCQSESSTFFKRIVGHYNCKAEVIISIQVEVFRYRFSEAIPIFFNRLKSVFFLVRSL